jgi:hypothetical protein
MPTPISTRTLALVALATGTCLLAFAAAPASAGTYRAAICHAGLGARHADAGFTRNSRHYLDTAGCGVGDDGLAVSHDGERTPMGRWGAWSVSAPAGTAIARLSAKAAGRSGGGHVPELLIGRLAGPMIPFATPGPGLERVTWSGSGAQVVSARLGCRRATGCGSRNAARIRIKRIVVSLDDRVRPTIGLGGSLFASGSRRGFETIEPRAADVGSGVRRLLVDVNGEPVTAQDMSCRVADGTALRLRPCPPRASTTFGAATALSPFRQGPNLVRVCAADYAPGTSANRTCLSRRVRVDNLCPLSGVSGGTRLHARLRAGGRGPTVAGRLLSAGGLSVAGARVCVATRVRGGRAPERVIATPTTGEDGRFSARLPRGPSRAVRVAYWPNATAAIERHLDLGVRGRPRLRVGPPHPIRNGDRAHFEVRLPRPARVSRRVEIQVRANGRWLELRGGRTGPGGRYRATYRFRATTGRRAYAFRAVVPRQAGYPYDAGRSRVRRITVIG